jgi:hypothetical protein
MRIDLIAVKARSVVYGIHFHKDTTRIVKKHDFLPDTLCCEVEAKRRPLLVITNAKRDRGKAWFIVLPVTSKGLSENGELKPNHIRIGNCIQEDRTSYLKLFAESVPCNLLSEDGTTCDLIKELDTLDFQHIVKILAFNGLKANTDLSGSAR